MMRAMFIAIGLATALVGLECLAVEKVMLTQPEQRVVQWGQPMPTGAKEIVPPDWAPWTLLSAGTIIVLYSFTLPRRGAPGP